MIGYCANKENNFMRKFERNYNTSDLPGEIFKPVARYEGLYEVSNLGRIRRLPRHISFMRNNVLVEYSSKMIILRPNVDYGGYWSVTLTKGSVSKFHQVHRIVAEAFLSDYSEDLQVDHVDEDKSNNAVSNLQMVSPSENVQRYHNNHRQYISESRSAIQKQLWLNKKLHNS